MERRSGGTGRMSGRGEGEGGRRGKLGGSQGAAIRQTVRTSPPPSNLRYTAYFLSPFRHRDNARREGTCWPTSQACFPDPYCAGNLK